MELEVCFEEQGGMKIPKFRPVAPLRRPGAAGSTGAPASDG